jgi:hypothetical protein
MSVIPVTFFVVVRAILAGGSYDELKSNAMLEAKLGARLTDGFRAIRRAEVPGSGRHNR